MWGELISAGASLIGGLFGDDEETTTTVDYDAMVRNAEKAGFNPLTAIRNGGSAGFTTTHHPALSAGSFISDALGKVGNAISSYDPTAKATADLEYKIRQETLANLQADTAARLRASLGGVPVTTGQSRTRVQRGALSTPPPKAGTDWFAPPASAGPLPLWVPAVDRDGKQVWSANPDGADIEQLAAAGVMRSQSGWERAVGALRDADVKITKAPKEEPASWWPSFGIKWQ
ncbi:hypothetical protein [Mesorhizobium sp. M1378]|uniref:hypothetical protein n=1 Tax=Mesorhizobium sp. M1378 TaxID=2957092 RepID=UPI00333A15C8